MNFIKIFKAEVILILHKLFYKIEEETVLKLFYDTGFTQSELDKNNTRKLQTNILHEYRGKILNKILANQIHHHKITHNEQVGLIPGMQLF